MAAYPSFTQLLGSTEEGVDDVTLDRAVDGSVKARGFYTARKRRFKLRHFLTSSERATLQTFYDTNRLLTVTLTWVPDGQTYTCLFQGPPSWDFSPGGGNATVDVTLVQV